MDRTATQIKQDAEDQCDVKVQAMESKFEALKSTLVDLSCELCDPIKTNGCDSNGHCICLEGYGGTRCNDCNTGYVRDASGLCKVGPTIVLLVTGNDASSKNVEIFDM